VTDYSKPMVRGLAFVRAVPYNVRVRCGILANLEARTPRLFWWGVRGGDTRSQGELATAHARAMPHQSSPGFCAFGLTGCIAQASKHGPGCIEKREDVAQTASAPKPIARVDPGTGGCMGQPHGVPVMRTSSVSHSVSSRWPIPSLVAGLGLPRPEPFGKLTCQ
jgi:hypothetical protein